MSEQDIVREDVTEAAAAPEQAGKKKKNGKKEKKKKSVGREILSWILTIVVAVVAALLIRSFIFELVRVEGGSMMDTLEDKEIMFVSKFDYSSTWLSLPFQSNNAVERAPRVTIGTPKMLDVVICRYPARGGVNFVKRIVGMPGDTVEIRDGYLYINGEQVAEESNIAGIEENYRHPLLGYSNGKEILSPQREENGPYYVPKKGDKAILHWTNATLTMDVGETEGWDRKSACVVMKTDGKTLKVCTRNVDEDSRETDSSKIRTETVISYDGQVYEPAQFFQRYPEMKEKELTIDEDYYFVMGDHRNNSNDSRSVGALERSAIIGHARGVVFPFADWRGVE